MLTKRNSIINHAFRHLFVTALAALLPATALAEDYGLIVAGVQVTSENADKIEGSNISGSVSYNASENELTLDNATISGGIKFYQAEGLTVHLIGENIIDGGYTADANGDYAFQAEATVSLSLTFTTNETTPGYLLIKNTYKTDDGAIYFAGYSEPTYKNGLYNAEGDDYKMLIGPVPTIAPEDGLYWTDQKFTITRRWSNSTIYVNEEEYTEPFSFVEPGEYQYFYYEDVTLDGTTFSIPGNGAYIVHKKPTFSIASGTYSEPQSVKIENLPSELPKTVEDYPQVWYYLGEDSQNPVQYTSENQTIEVSSSTKIHAYIKDKIAEPEEQIFTSEAIETEYTILQSPNYHFTTQADGSTYYSDGSTVNLGFDDESVNGILVAVIPEELTVSYSSSDENIATISSKGEITLVGGGEVMLTASNEATETYSAYSVTLKLKVRPADPVYSLPEGAYYTGEKLTLTNPMKNGTITYAYGYDEAANTYDAETGITLPVGKYDLYAWITCGTEKSYGNNHTVYYVYDQPTISKDSGTYDPMEVEITNLPTDETYTPSVYYYFDDNEEEAQAYTAESKISINESKTLKVYIYVEGDSGKNHKTPVIEREYTIRKNPGLQFLKDKEDVEVAEYTIGGTENEALPTLSNEAKVTVTYSSSDTNVVTISSEGVITFVGVGETTITATSAQTDSYMCGEASYTLRVFKDLTDSSISIEVAETIYTGSALEPSVTVKDGDTNISEYVTVSYTNNTNAALSTAETPPTITVTPKDVTTANRYTGSVKKTFTIAKADINPTVSITGWTYGTANKPSVEGNPGGGSVTYSYKAEGEETYSSNVPTAVGTYTLKAVIAETDNYNIGEATATFTITARSINDAAITLSASTFTYDDTVKNPIVTIQFDSDETTLSSSTDFEVNYQKNTGETFEDVEATSIINAGTYKVIATGKGNYSGTKEADFTINKADINPTVSITDWTYGSTANTPSVEGNPGGGSVTYSYKAEGEETYSSNVPTAVGTYTLKAVIAETDNYNIGEATATFTITARSINDAAITLSASTFTYDDTVKNPIVTIQFDSDETTLSSSTDFEVNYQKNTGEAWENVNAENIINAGTYKVIATGKGNYEGTASTTFTIAPKNLGAASFSEITNLTYTGCAITPEPTITINLTEGATSATTLVEGSDFDFSYSNNTNAATSDDGSNAPTVTITGKGNYNGTASAKFTIGKANLANVVIADIANQTYTGEAITPAINVTFNGKDVNASEYETGYDNNTKVSTTAATITLTSTGKNFTSGTKKTVSFTIVAKALTDEMVTITPTTIKVGDKITVIVKDGDKELKEADYSITYKQGDNTVDNPAEVGSYDIIVTGSGNYTGTVTKTITISRALDITFASGQTWASYYATEDLIIPDGLKAYAVSNVDEDAGTVTTKELTYIPKNKAVLLESTGDAAEGFTAAPYSGTETSITNLLEGSTEDVNVNSFSGTVYVLYNNVFKRTTSGSIPARRAYLVVNSNAQARLSIVYGGSTTSIELSSDDEANDSWYSLDGRKQNRKPLRAGLYIKNGKKVFVNSKK